jgi:class 3 adenylate cyclase/pimeloyl-ACP methyl ester carboxylesterase
VSIGVLAQRSEIGHDEHPFRDRTFLRMTRLRWAVLDDASVAFEVRGSGPNVVEIPNGAGLVWADHPLTRAWPERVEEFARFVSYDGIGTGRADALPPGRVPTVEDKVAEAIAVMDAAETEDAVLVAWFAAVPVALALAAAHPERVRGMVVVNGFARLVEDEDFPAGVPRGLRDEFERSVAEQYGSGWMVERWVPEVAHHPEVRAFMERYEQSLAKRGQIVQLSKFVSSLDVRDQLPMVATPVTIIHARDNRVVPHSLGVDLNERVRGSNYIEVPTSHHLFTLPPMLDIVIEQTRTMTTGDPGTAARASLVALVMTDIVGSTERLAALRDAAWAALLDEYHRRSAETVERFGGRRINSMGDGLLATFDSASAALRCAAALTRISRDLGIKARASVHVGDVEVLGDDIAGLAVHITSRLLDQAPDGGVVVSDTAAQAAIGAGYSMHPLDPTELRGIPGQWQVFELDV